MRHTHASTPFPRLRGDTSSAQRVQHSPQPAAHKRRIPHTRNTQPTRTNTRAPRTSHLAPVTCFDRGAANALS
eukprot:9484363-Pyramimonas_sp.AAC.1